MKKARASGLRFTPRVRRGCNLVPGEDSNLEVDSEIDYGGILLVNRRNGAPLDPDEGPLRIEFVSMPSLIALALSSSAAQSPT
jgi:hypothetical protein